MSLHFSNENIRFVGYTRYSLRLMLNQTYASLSTLFIQANDILLSRDKRGCGFSIRLKNLMLGLKSITED